jgi:Flp pilus assembly protein TadB
MNDDNLQDTSLKQLSRRQRFEVRRAVYGGSAVRQPALAAAAVAHARQLKYRPRRWSGSWFRSFLLDPFDAPAFVVLCVLLLVIWPSVITVAIAVGAFILIAVMTRSRRRRKAERAEVANQRLLEERPLG